MNSRVKRWLWPALVTAMLALWLSYSMLPLSVSAPNERSRLYLTVALFERHSFDIDVERQRFGRVLDEAEHGGHSYSDKAPGSSLLALPAYALYRTLVPETSVTVEALLLLGRYGVMLPISLVGFWGLVQLAVAIGVRPRHARLASMVWLLATPAFHYSVAFFGHHLVAVLWVLALWLLHLREPSSKGSRWVRFGCLGLLLSLAQLVEYQAVIGTALLTIYALHRSRDAWRSHALALFLGALPGALFFLSYNAHCFGGMLELSYGHLSHPGLASVHGRGMGGVLLPSAEGLQHATLSLHRGLFATSPVLVLGPLGLWCLGRRGYVALALVLTFIVLGYLLLMAGSLTWEAGWGYGPRLLVPVFPWLILGIASALSEWGDRPLWWAALGSLLLASGLLVQSVVSSFAEPPVECRNPVLDLVWPLLRAGVVEDNLGSRALGLSGCSSFLPLVGLFLGSVSWFCTEAVRATGSRRVLWGLPVAPLVVGSIIAAVGATTSASEQAGLVRFVRSLQDLSP